MDDFAQEERLEDREMVVRYRNRKGELRCHGGRHLKKSQAYPKQSLIKKMEKCFKMFPSQEYPIKKMEKCFKMFPSQEFKGVSIPKVPFPSPSLLSGLVRLWPNAAPCMPSGLCARPTSFFDQQRGLVLRSTPAAG